MSSEFPEHAEGMNPAWLALSRFRRRRFTNALDLSTQQLKQNPRDELMWFLKARTMTQMVYVDDTDFAEEALAGEILNEEAMAAVPRPGTSLKHGARTSLRSRTAAGQGMTARVPLSGRGRLSSGFARPGSQRHQASTASGRGTRAGLSSARPISVAGRYLRPGTASLLTGGGDQFIVVSKLNSRSFASRPALARALIDYLLWHEHNPRMALNICAAASEKAEFSDAWLKFRMGRCYTQLGLLREAEEQYRSALRQHHWPQISLELAQVYVRMQQPLRALDTYAMELAVPTAQNEISYLTGIARAHELVGEEDQAADVYRRILVREPTNVEALACLASYLYYNDQPERALRLYRRAELMGVRGSAIYNNMAICALAANQGDVCLMWLMQSLQGADDLEAADIWYNVGHVAIISGDEVMARQALSNCLALCPEHAEAHNNLGVMELKKTPPNLEMARSRFESAVKANDSLVDAHMNLAIVCQRLGLLESAYGAVVRAQELDPSLEEACEMVSQLEELFSSMGIQ